MCATKQEFKDLVAKVEATKGYRRPLAWGIGRITRDQINHDKVLQVIFPFININCNFDSFAAIYSASNTHAQLDARDALNGISVKLNSQIVKCALVNLAPFVEEAIHNSQINLQVLQNLYKAVSSSNSAAASGCALVDVNEYRLIAIFGLDKVVSLEATHLRQEAFQFGRLPLLNTRKALPAKIIYTGRNSSFTFVNAS